MGSTRPIKERDVERALVEHIRKLGGEIRKVVFPGHSGAPDRVVLFPDGELTWVELKSPLGSVAPHQAREHARFRALGQTVLVLRSVTDIKKAFPE